MSDQYEIEPAHRVYDNDSGVGACIEARVCPDFPNNVLLWTPDEESQKYYGPIRLSMTAEHAKTLRDALTRQLKAMGVE